MPGPDLTDPFTRLVRDALIRKTIDTFCSALDAGGEDSPDVQGMLAEYPDESDVGGMLRITLNVWLQNR